jgi:cell division protein FtsJ
VLANWALDGLQRELGGICRTRREATAAKVNFVRYADDFIITASSKEFLENEVKPRVRSFLAGRGLELSDAKTVVTHVQTGFDFLGWTVRWRGGMLLTQPSKKNVKDFLAKVRGTLREMRTARQADVIAKLNPVIRGWANYHRSQMATRRFAKTDHQIWQALWRWACRRHPNKGARWIKARYFRCVAGRDWQFADKDKLLRPGIAAVDLGAAPGSWTQVIRERLSRHGKLSGRVLALDILPMEPLPDVDVIQGDFRDESVEGQLEAKLGGAKVDVVVSDMAPNLSGVAAADAARSLLVAELALEFAVKHLKPDGAFLVKAFQGSGHSQFVERLKRNFRSVAVRKPAASRESSAEVYLLARGLRAPTVG